MNDYEYSNESANSQPAGVPSSKANNTIYASTIILEFRKNYLFDKLIYLKYFADLARIESNNSINNHEGDYRSFSALQRVIALNSFLQNFLQ